MNLNLAQGEKDDGWSDDEDESWSDDDDEGTSGALDEIDPFIYLMDRLAELQTSNAARWDYQYFP